MKTVLLNTEVFTGFRINFKIFFLGDQIIYVNNKRERKNF